MTERHLGPISRSAAKLVRMFGQVLAERLFGRHDMVQLEIGVLTIATVELFVDTSAKRRANSVAGGKPAGMHLDACSSRSYRSCASSLVMEKESNAGGLRPMSSGSHW